jgi:lipooligosaccharide transport system permease protein
MFQLEVQPHRWSGWCFAIEPGQIFGFLGPNGAGKSSTMRMIACVSPRSGGSLQVLGMDPDVDGPRIRARIGVVPQLDNLDTELTVRENLEIYGRYFGLSRAHVRRKAVELMGFAQLGDRANAAVESLSGGMKRRLTIARSLVNDPALLLLDEPTQLDTGPAPAWDRLYRLKGEGVTSRHHALHGRPSSCATGGDGRRGDRGRGLAGRAHRVLPTREVLGWFAPGTAAPVELVGNWQTVSRSARPAPALHRERRAPAGRAGPSEREAAVRARASLVAGRRVPSAHRPESGGVTMEHTDLPVARSATGRATGPMGGVLLVVEHHWTWYRRNWRATAVSSILQPLLFLLAFGVGFGTLIDGTGRAAQATGGLDYLVWLAPALLCVSAVQTAVFDSTYPVLSGLKWQRHYLAMTATPIGPGQVVAGHLVWMMIKICGCGAIYVAVIAVFGGVRSPGIVLALLIAMLAAAAVGALVTAFTAGVEDEGSAFTVLFRLVLIPMTLFSGTFFPVDRLPAAIQPVTWVSPLWHGTELSRAAALGGGAALPAVGHAAVLLVLVAAGSAAAVVRFRRRLYR